MNRDQIAILRKQLEGLVPDERSSGHWQLGFYEGRDAAAKLLLDLAERGLEAEADITNAYDAIFPFVPELNNEQGGPLSVADKICLLAQELAAVTAERDAAVAELTRLRGLLTEWHDAFRDWDNGCGDDTASGEHAARSQRFSKAGGAMFAEARRQAQGDAK